MELKITTYREMGAMIAGIGRPLFIVMEGGYAENLSACVGGFIEGISEGYNGPASGGGVQQKTPSR